VEMAEIDGIATDTIEIDGERKLRIYASDEAEE